MPHHKHQTTIIPNWNLVSCDFAPHCNLRYDKWVMRPAHRPCGFVSVSSAGSDCPQGYTEILWFTIKLSWWHAWGMPLFRSENHQSNRESILPVFISVDKPALGGFSRWNRPLAWMNKWVHEWMNYFEWKKVNEVELCLCIKTHTPGHTITNDRLDLLFSTSRIHST